MAHALTASTRTCALLRWVFPFPAERVPAPGIYHWPDLRSRTASFASWSDAHAETVCLLRHKKGR